MNRCIKPRFVRLTKLEAARRQIESAIWLWFVGDDLVSVHALTAAAHRLLLELAALRETAAWPYTAAYLPKRTYKDRPRQITKPGHLLQARKEEGNLRGKRAVDRIISL